MGAKENRTVWLFLLVPAAMAVTAAAYYLFEHVFYIPDAKAGYAVFLAPRFYGAMNDLYSGIFQQWANLAWVVPCFAAVIAVAWWLGIEKAMPFRRYLWVMYVLTLGAAFLFLFLTPHGLLHIQLQVESINNGIWSAFGALDNTPAFRDATALGKVQYIFQVLGSNEAGYTIPGTTHPPGLFLVVYFILDVSKFIAKGLLGRDAHAVAATWGILVTMLNCLMVPVIMKLAKETYSEEVARWTGIFMLVIPSVCIHFCAMVDGIASLMCATAMLFMVLALMADFRGGAQNRYRQHLSCGVGAGAFLTLAAQMTYGHAFPILALIVAFYFVRRKSPLKGIAAFSLGLAIPAVLYFAFEYWISAGTSFWIVRAMAITRAVGAGLDSARPYPLAQVANFLITSVMGGVLFLPVLIYVSVEVFRNAVAWWKQARPDSASETTVRRFMFVATFLMLLLLLSQTTVRLEVERTWHWFFIPVWVLMGPFILSPRVVVERLFSGAKTARAVQLAPLGLVAFQLMLTVMLAMSIQDYY